MIQKYVDGAFVSCAGLQEIRLGDLFRFVDGERTSPLMCANADAIQKPSATDPSRIVWAVDATSAIEADSPISGRLN